MTLTNPKTLFGTSYSQLAWLFLLQFQADRCRGAHCCSVTSKLIYWWKQHLNRENFLSYANSGAYANNRCTTEHKANFCVCRQVALRYNNGFSPPNVYSNRVRRLLMLSQCLSNVRGKLLWQSKWKCKVQRRAMTFITSNDNAANLWHTKICRFFTVFGTGFG